MNRALALSLVGAAGIFWASSGIAVQDFFAHSDKSAIDLTNIRMLFSGFLILIIAWQNGGLKKSFSVLNHRPRMWLDVVIYGTVGMAFMQFSYFEAISIGGAVATTVIQYSCPAIVVLWHSFYYRRLPKLGEVIAVILATSGVFLLVTGGNFDKLMVPLACVLWALASGASFAFSSIFPSHLFTSGIDKYFLTSVGMIIGGFFTFALVDEVNLADFFASNVIFDVICIIIFGTVAAFLLFNAGLIYLTAEEASVTATTEPVASVILAYFIFGTTFGLIESIGIVLVILAILAPIILNHKLNRNKH